MTHAPVSRRDLLKTTALAASAIAFPTIVPSSVFGATAPSNRINLAAIGNGGRATGNIHGAFLPLKDARIIAAVDCWEQRRVKFAKMCNDYYKADICKPIADFREALARPDIDGVIISTPDHWHVPLAWHAAKAKKDMYVEKPLGVAMAWAWKLREEINKNKVVFQYGTQQRGDQQQFRHACELALNGYLGKIQRVEVWAPAMPTQKNSATNKAYGSTEPSTAPADLNYDMWIGPAPMKPYTVDRCTCYGAYHIYDYALGFIAGWGAHPLDIAQWGLGMDDTSPVHYEGTGLIPPAGSLWDSVESWDIQCKYANGIPMRFMSHQVAMPIVQQYNPHASGHGTTFYGEKGWISVDRRKMYSSDPALEKVQIKESEKQLYAAKGQARNFVDCIRSREKTISPFESAIRSDTISHLSDIVVRTGRAITWDPAAEQIVGDAEASKHLDRPMREGWKIG